MDTYSVAIIVKHNQSGEQVTAKLDYCTVGNLVKGLDESIEFIKRNLASFMRERVNSQDVSSD